MHSANESTLKMVSPGSAGRDQVESGLSIDQAIPGPCQLCGSKKIVEFQVPQAAQLWHCPNCELYQYGRMAEKQAYAEHYHEGYEKHREKKIRTAHVRLNRISHFLPARPRLLDIGCSVGATVQAAKERGWIAKGVDVSQDAVDYCKSLGLDCKVISPNLLPFESSTFDAIVSWHVIEHVADVRDTLREWRRVLKPGGIMFLETPDATCGKVRRLKEKYRKFWAPEHTYTFSPDSLAGFLHKSGFQLVPAPTIGSLRQISVTRAAYACAYQSYQGFRSMLGVNKAFQICARRAA
jgi:2-polyprenyl-3-methyl-5-hydroxy-6-metoxy-1,4-benzoquinol methylase